MKITPTKIQSLIVSLLLAFGLGAQAQLLNETFDSSAGFAITDGNDAVSPFFSDGFGDYFGIFDGDSDGGADFGTETTNPSGTVAYTNFSDNYLVNEDMDGDGTVIPYTLTWSGITLSGETNLGISADFASSRADADDYIVISYRVDAGPWVEILGVAGASGTNGPVFEITDFVAQNGDAAATAVTIDFTNVSSTFTLAGAETTLDIKAEFSNNNGDDNFGMDNLVVQVVVPPSVLPATDLTAAAAALPGNKDTISVSFTQNAATDDVLIVYSTDDIFGAPVDSTSYSPDDVLPGGGTVAGVFSSAPATISGLAPGTTYFFVAYSVNGSDEYSLATSSVSAATATFALQSDSFSDWTVVEVLGDDTWVVGFDGSSANISGFQGTNPEEDWLVSPVIDLDGFAGETFEFDYNSQFVDPVAIGLELFYTTAYTGDPTTTTWVAFTTINTDFDTNKSIDNATTSTFGASIDLSAITGTTVQLAFKYITGGVADDARTWTLNDPLLSGNGASEEAITLSATPADVDEGAARTVTLSVLTNVGSDTDFFLSSNGDGSELTFPAIVTILSGTNSIDFTVNGLTDGATDGDIAVDLIANRSAYTVGSLAVTVNDIDALIPAGDIVITQYYEGSSNNKYLELTNVSGSPVDMTGYILVRWGNALAEEYKTATAAPVSDDYGSLDLTPLGTLIAGQTVILANADAVAPVDAGDAALTQAFSETNGVLSFNGNDSLVIYNTAAPIPANIVDAIGFTSAGFEGGNTSFIRSSLFLGYNLASGSNATSPQYSTVWTEVTTASVDAALVGEDAYLGSTDLVAAPPSVRFVEGTQIVGEADGTVTLTVLITSPDGNAVDVDVVFNSGSSDADVGDIGTYTTQTVSFGSGAVDGDTQTVVITLTDDATEESTESAIFDLGNLVTSGGTTIVNPSTTTVFIQDDDTVIPNLIISELADPNDNGGTGRYIELYNPSGESVDLAAGNWNLVYYVNEQTGGNDIPLTGTIAPGGTYIIAEDANFSTVYPSATSDIQTGTANGNGDDNVELRFGGGQSSGTLVDVYGSPGTDGTGQPSEYEDGRAFRNADITTGNTTWTASEWTIFSDQSGNPNGIAVVADMTPGIHPESTIPAPTGVSATTISDTEIEIAFTTADSNDVVIVFNETGTFTEPTGTALVGQALAGGTALYIGQSSPQSHTGLSAETQYFYAVYSVTVSDEYSNVVAANATTDVAPLVGVINVEDFEDPIGDADDWFNASVTGDDPWDLSVNDALIDGLTTDSGAAEEHYLVSPAFDFTSETGLTITFDYAGGFDVAALDSLELVYSTDYTGSGDPEASATWTPITFAFSNIIATGAVRGVLQSSGVLSLPSALDGQATVHLAFRYNSDGTLANTEQWLIDNIIVQGAVSATPLADYLTLRGLVEGDLGLDTNDNGFTVLEEYLSGFGDGVGPDAIEYGIDVDGTLALTLTNDLATIPDGITVSLLATSDLTVAFAPVAFTRTVVDNGDGTFTHSYTETTPPASDTRFLQLSITAD